jgi:hypothetical protein
MFQRGGEPGLALEARQPLLLIGFVGPQELDRDLASEAEIFRTEHDPHATFPKLVENTIVGDDRLGHGI